ncbi:MAG: glycosyltransferase, partial [Actinomycetota bacterium]|nr:glycosyltransferase [Actinomycetota bacterium]
APLRRAALVAGWLVAGIPSCLAGVRSGDTLHVEGWFKPVLLVPLAVLARHRGARVVLNPHLTFSRDRRRAPEAVMRWLARRADAVLATSDVDHRRIEGWGAPAVRVGLVVDVPHPDHALIAAWRDRWQAADGSRRVVLLAGRLRPDKGLDVLVRAASLWPLDLRLAVVGEDDGALAPARRLAADLGVDMEVDEGHQPLDHFVAAVAAADLVACPYRQAGQSAVLALAAALGRPTVASDAGGLPELASVVVPVGDPHALAAGVEQALTSPPRRPSDDPVGTYVEAYGLLTVTP